MKIKFFSPLIICFLFITYGCKDKGNEPVPPVNDINNGFEKYEVAEIFATSCALADCHASGNPQHNLSIISHQTLMKGSLNRPMDSSAHNHGKISRTLHDEGSVYGGEAVIPFNSERSLLYNLITGNIQNPDHRMPYLRPPLTDNQVRIIKEWIDGGAKDNNGNVPFAGHDNKIYAASQGDDVIYEIDKGNMVVSRIIDVNLNAAGLDQPHNIQLKDNNLYVSLISSGHFLKIDRSTRQITGTVSGLQVPGMIAITPDGSRAFVSRSSSAASIYNSIYVINTNTMQIIDEIILPVTGLPHAIALSKDGSTLYAANMSRDRISVVNAVSLEVEEEIMLSSGAALVHEPMHIYLSPDDKYLYINCRTSSKMLVMDTGTREIIKDLDIKHHPMQMAVSLDGSRLYVVSHHEPYITTIIKSGSDWMIESEFESTAFHSLYGADLSDDGKYLFVTCSNNAPDHFFTPHYVVNGRERSSLVCIYDTHTKHLVKIIDIGKNATGITAR